MGQIVHIVLNQPLEIKHHARPALRVGRCPSRLCGKRRLHRALQHRCIPQNHLRLNTTFIGVEHIAKTLGRAPRPAHNEMINLTHVRLSEK